MGQVPRELTPLESALHFFGAELRHWRTMRRLSQTALGRRTHDSGALIGKIEKGERFPSLALTRRLDVVLDTGGAKDVQRLAPGVLVSSGGMERRRVLCMIALASSSLPSDGNVHSDIDQVCDLIGQVILSLGSMRSARSLERVNSVRRALAPYAGRSSVQEVEERFRSTIAVVGTPR